MSLLNIENFKANLAQGGAKTNLFEVRVLGTGVDAKASYLCKAASFPGVTIEPIVIPFRGRQIKVAGDKTFESWELTFYNDNQFVVRKAYEAWSSNMVSHDTGLGNLVSIQGGADSYKRDLEVVQLDKKTGTATTNVYYFKGAFPSTISPIELDYDNGDIQQFTVTMEYDYWTTTAGSS